MVKLGKNKRTAFLIMNGIISHHPVCPLTARDYILLLDMPDGFGGFDLITVTGK